jgi:putative copper export protein
VAKDIPATAHRSERVLAFMIAGIVGLSIVTIFVVLIGTGAGLSRIAPASVWQALTLFPFVGLSVGFLMIITLLVVSARRRSRETQAATARSTRIAPTTRKNRTTRTTRTTRK